MARSRKPNPNPTITQILITLRTDVGLTQSGVGELFRVDYKAVGRWETGESIPRNSHRPRFIRYLLDTAKLSQDLPRFFQVWDQLMVGEWDWPELDPDEKWLAYLAGRSRVADVPHPSMPLFPNAKAPLGRSQLLESIVERLQENNRVALVGMPGVGKTALSIAVAEHSLIRERFSGGVLWGHLGKEPNVENLLVRWGEKLGEDLASFAGIREKAERIRDIIDARPVLLIIDDAWSLIPALQVTCGARRSGHLLTTRQRDLAQQYAGVARVHTVPELDTKPANELLEQLAPTAYAVNRHKTEDLVAAVGGLPLALVLLGGFLDAREHRYFNDTQEIAIDVMQEAERRLELAQARLGTFDDQTLTLRQVIELSIESLSLSEQQAFWSLGAFAPKPIAFSRRAAEYVGECEVTTLTGLVDHNLLELDGAGDLMMHQVLSDYARGFCADSALDRHRDFYVYFAHQHEDDFPALWSVYDQLKHTWQRQENRDRYDPTFLALMTSLETFQELQGLLHDRKAILDRGLEILTTLEDDDAMVSGLLSMGQIRLKLGESAQALESFKLALSTSEVTGNLRGQAASHRLTASAYSQLDQPRRAIEHLKSALDILDELKKDMPDEDMSAWRMQRAACFNQLGIQYHTIGDKQTALAFYLRAKVEQEELGDSEGLATTLGNIGMLYSDMEETDEALRYYDQSLSIHREIGSKIGVVHILNNLGSSNLSLNQIDSALEYFHEALKISQDAGAVVPQATSLHLIGCAHEHRGEYETALEYLHRAYELRKRTGEVGSAAATLSEIGIVYAAIRSDDPRALELQLEALQVAVETESKSLEYDIRDTMVDIAIQNEVYHSVVEQLTAMVDLADQYGFADADDLRRDLNHFRERLQSGDSFDDKSEQ